MSGIDSLLLNNNILETQYETFGKEEFIVENDTNDNIVEENIGEKDDDGIMYDLSKLTVLYYFLIIYLFSMTLMTS